MKDLKCELLAPAGNYECFIAAIKAGADAVYAGGSKFGARAYAENFTQDELLKAIDAAHLREKRLYLTVNTVLKNPETEELYEYIRPLYEQGLDGVIVQDIGVIKKLGRDFPGLPIHASTQMAITDVAGVKLLQKLGITRVVPARELSLNELKVIAERTGIELECFIHGALCYSFSGKCLFSSIAGGRSGNRGRCAGPCRLPYNGKYILSAKDICTLKILPQLIDAGIASFKIEGRMKSREYVAGVTGIYRKYIDKYLNDDRERYSVDEKDFEELTGIYTRSGNCTGYYFKRNGYDMITIERPSYETADDAKLKELYDKYTEGEDRPKMNGVLTAYADQRLTLTLECGEHVITCEGDVADKARNRPTDEADLRKHLCKTGESELVFDELNIYAGDDIFVPVSSINSLRRTAIEKLKEEILKAFRRNTENDGDQECVEKSAKTGIGKSRSAHINNENMNTDNPGRRSINCRIDKIGMLDDVLDYDIVDSVSVGLEGFTDMRSPGGIPDIRKHLLCECSEKVRESGKRFNLTLPEIIRDDFFERYKELEGLLNKGIADGVIIDNYESLYYLSNIGYRGEIISDIHMYVLNDDAAEALYELGVTRITCPAELKAGELKWLNMKKGEFLIYGRLPMMISAGCTAKTTGSCKYDNGISMINDRLGNVFPVQRHCRECYNTILNCVPLLISPDKVPEAPGIDSCRIHFTVENSNEIKNVMDYYRDCLEGKDPQKPDIKYTLGHYKRGVE